MADLRARLAAVALIAGILAASAASVFAQNLHPVCAAMQHDCGRAATIAKCCCGGQATPSHDGTPARARIDITPDASATPALPAVSGHAALGVAPTPVVDTSPPRWCLLDRPTLFGVLLI